MKEITLRPSDGGRLITTQAPENVGPENYTQKDNWRRVDDCERVREAFNIYAPANTLYALGLWEATRPNGERATVVATDTGIYRVTDAGPVLLGSGFTATWWQGESIDGYLILNNGNDLPVYFRVEDTAVVPLYELREIGFARVNTLCVANGFLILGGTHQIPSTELTAWMNGPTPYGRYTGTTNDIGFEIIWSDFGKPTNWAPVISGTIQSANKFSVVLDHPSQAFPVGTRLAVTNAGPNGGILGGQSEIPDGVVVTAVSGATLTLGTSADAAATYPLTVQVSRWDDTSTFVGSSKIQDDGTDIVCIKPLKQLVVVYRTSVIFTGRFTGEVNSPFIFTPAYRGFDVPTSTLTVGAVSGDYHVYPTASRFCFFDGAGAPQIHRTLDDARTLYFTNYVRGFAAENLDTKEIWFGNGTRVLCFDYHSNTASCYPVTAVMAACQMRAPLGFICVIYGILYQQSLTTFLLRGGVPEWASLRGGAGALRDDHNQKVLRGVGPLLGGSAGTQTLFVQVSGRDNGVSTNTSLFSETVVTNDVTPLVETFFRNVYFEDLYTAVGSSPTARASIAGRTFKYIPVATHGGTRNNTGNA